VVYPVPCWNNDYYTHLVSADAIIIETREENRFLLQAEELESHLGEATLLALGSPQNPAGTLFSSTELRKICDAVIDENNRREGRKKLYILFDQLYSQLIYSGTHYNPVEVCPGIRPWLVTVDAISKSFAATGIRVGWCLGPEGLVSKMKVLLAHIGAWAPMPEQKGLARYLGDHKAITAFLAQFRSRLKRRLDLVYAGIIRLKKDGYPVDAIAPRATVFLSLKIGLIGLKSKNGTLICNSEKLTAFLLEEAGIALVPFYAFGTENNQAWFRLSIGTCKINDIPVLLAALRKMMDQFTEIPVAYDPQPY